MSQTPTTPTQPQTILEKIQAVNDRLRKGEPHNITENTHSSYASSGYKSQAIIDAMNIDFGIGNWCFEELSDEVIFNKDGKPVLALAHIRIWLIGVDAQFTAWGQCTIPGADIGDAKKGAVTDALKKGLAYFSIGNRAFHGLLKK